MCHSGEYMARSSRMGVKCAFLNSIKNRHVSKIAWLDHYTCQLSVIDILCQAQFLSWYTLVRVIFFLSQKEDKVKGMSTWWTYKHIFPFYFAKEIVLWPMDNEAEKAHVTVNETTLFCLHFGKQLHLCFPSRFEL